MNLCRFHSISAVQERNARRTDRRTDKPSYIDAWTYLKIEHFPAGLSRILLPTASNVRRFRNIYRMTGDPVFHGIAHLWPCVFSTLGSWILGLVFLDPGCSKTFPFQFSQEDFAGKRGNSSFPSSAQMAAASFLMISRIQEFLLSLSFSSKTFYLLI